jgi:hypothetical protein
VQLQPFLDLRAMLVQRVSLVNEDPMVYQDNVSSSIACYEIGFHRCIVVGGLPGPRGLSGNPGKFVSFTGLLLYRSRHFFFC